MRWSIGRAHRDGDHRSRARPRPRHRVHRRRGGRVPRGPIIATLAYPQLGGRDPRRNLRRTVLGSHDACARSMESVVALRCLVRDHHAQRLGGASRARSRQGRLDVGDGTLGPGTDLRSPSSCPTGGTASDGGVTGAEQPTSPPHDWVACDPADFEVKTGGGERRSERPQRLSVPRTRGPPRAS